MGCPIFKNDASAKINVIFFEKLGGASLNDHLKHPVEKIGVHSTTDVLKFSWGPKVKGFAKGRIRNSSSINFICVNNKGDQK